MYWGWIWMTAAVITTLVAWRKGSAFAAVASLILVWGGMANAVTIPGEPAQALPSIVYLCLLLVTYKAVDMLDFDPPWFQLLREQVTICLVALGWLSLCGALSWEAKTGLNGLFGLSQAVLWWHMLRPHTLKAS